MLFGSWGGCCVGLVVCVSIIWISASAKSGGHPGSTVLVVLAEYPTVLESNIISQDMYGGKRKPSCGCMAALRGSGYPLASDGVELILDSALGTSGLA